MRIRHVLASTSAAVLLATTALVGTASAGSAAGCIISAWSSTASDYAVTSDANGKCSTVRVGHYFNPGNISSTIYTGTFSDPDWVRTGTARELSWSTHSGS